MAYNETNDVIVNDEIIGTKPINNQYKTIDPLYNELYYHKTVAPVECDIYGCSVVNRALCSHKKTATCNLVKQFENIAQLEYDEVKLTHNITT